MANFFKNYTGCQNIIILKKSLNVILYKKIKIVDAVCIYLTVILTFTAFAR